ncbi:MAG: methyl-accepting chemotaxis protein [Fusobacteriota bacterium]
MYNIKNVSLKLKLLFSVIIIIAVSIVTAGIITTQNFEKKAHEKLRRSLKKHLIASEMLIDRETKSLQDTGKLIAKNSSILIPLKLNMTNQLSKYAEKNFQNYDGVDDIAIASKDRIIYSSSNKYNDLLKKSMGNHEENRGFYSSDGLNMVSITPLYIQDEYVGILFLARDLGNSDSIILEIGKSIQTTIFLYNGPRLMIASDKKGKIIAGQTQILDKNKLDNIYGANNHYEKDGDEILGNLYYINYRPIKDISGEYVGSIAAAQDAKVIKSEIKEIIKILTLIFSIVIVLLILLISIMVSYLFKPLEKLVGFLSIIFKGDLTKRLKVKSDDEIGKVISSVNDTIEIFRDTMQKIYDEQIVIKNSTEEINAGNKNLADKTTNQALSLQNTASEVNDLTGLISESTLKITEISDATKNTSRKIKKIESASSELKVSMEEITDSSKRIEKIIEIMDDISSQTNLLAINAAVEASKSGEEGKGFAVIAREIRNLAKKSSQSTKEIRAFIKHSKNKVKEGNLHLDETLVILDDIIKEVQNINIGISKISASAEEQKKGIDVIQSEMETMENITQDNAAVAEEIASISSRLNEETDKFEDTFEFFNFDKEKIDYEK